VTRRVRQAGAAVLVAAATLAGCAGNGTSSPARGGTGPGERGHGNSGGATVRVLYAGSLAHLMQHDLGPGFEQASGDAFHGYAGGSTALAAQIAGKVRRADVFVSASRKADADAGSFVRWSATFATAPVVIGYNPKSHFADDFRHKPWYAAIRMPGIKVGRTDPKLDPKGKRTVAAIDQAAAKLGRPHLKQALGSFPVYPEQTLVGRLQAGQLDAGFFYSIEAKAAGIPTVRIDPAAQQATYTVTVLDGAPHHRAAVRFVRYLLGERGTATLRRSGFHAVAPAQLSGSRQAVPARLRSLVDGR
jgi:molybdate/tungstate transport system substrate-binding protein